MTDTGRIISGGRSNAPGAGTGGRTALTAAVAAGVAAIALIVLAVYMFAQSGRQAPPPEGQAHSIDSAPAGATAGQQPQPAKGGGKVFTDRVGADGSDAVATAASPVPSPGGKLITDRIGGDSRPDPLAPAARPPGSGTKLITDRIVGDAGVAGE